MTSDNKTEGETPQSTPTPANDPGGPASAESTATQTESGSSAHTQSSDASEVDKLKTEVAELKDRLLRTHAEMDNIRKRLEREKSEIAKFAITKFAKDVVVIGDNVQRAIDAVPENAAEQDTALKGFLEGVTMIEREFINVLERHGVKRLDPKGEQFNPHFHQAVMEMPVPDVASGTVTQVFQAGYTIEERVLRPAMVVVAKGGMKPQSSDAEPQDASPAAEASAPDATTGTSQEPAPGSENSADPGTGNTPRPDQGG